MTQNPFGGQAFNTQTSGQPINQGFQQQGFQQQGMQQQGMQQNQYLSQANQFFESDMTKMGLNYAQNKLGTQMQGISSDFFADKIFNQRLRYYFDVSNAYVLKKLQIVFIPFIQRGEWKAQVEFGENPDNTGSGLSARDDVHAPDLYIPLMAVITFILFSSFAVGMNGALTPEDVSSNITKCFVASFIELMINKLVFFLLNIKNAGFLDLLSHLNYRYVSLAFLVIINISFGSYVTYLTFLYLMIASVYFVYKTFKRYGYTAMNESFGQSIDIRSKVFLILACVQVFFSWILLKITGGYT